jgi:hypothetical protein
MTHTYKPALMSYIDLLGFSELIDHHRTDPQTVRDTLELATGELSELSRRSHTRRLDATFHVANFSDLIVRCSTPVTGDPKELVVDELDYLAGAQFALVKKGVLIRGAICVGDMYVESESSAEAHHPRFFFGHALVKSYRLEQDYAIYPRLIIDRDLVQRGSSGAGIMENDQTVRRGEDGVYCLNYLYAAFMKAHGKSPKSALAILLDHRQAVETLLEDRVHKPATPEKKATERQKQKFMWLGLYHNSVIRQLKAKSYYSTNIAKLDQSLISPGLLRF